MEMSLNKNFFKKFKNIFLRLDSILIIFSLFLLIYTFCGSGLCLLKKDGNSMVLSNHNRNFLISKVSDKIKIFDGNKQIREIKVPDEFFFDKLSYNKYNSNVSNCAFVAAVAGGAVLAAAGGGLAAGLGLAETELAGLFEMAAAGATVGEVWAAIVELVGFWAAVGVGIGAVA